MPQSFSVVGSSTGSVAGRLIQLQQGDGQVCYGPASTGEAVAVAHLGGRQFSNSPRISPFGIWASGIYWARNLRPEIPYCTVIPFEVALPSQSLVWEASSLANRIS